MSASDDLFLIYIVNLFLSDLNNACQQ